MVFPHGLVDVITRNHVCLGAAGTGKTTLAVASIGPFMSFSLANGAGCPKDVDSIDQPVTPITDGRQHDGIQYMPFSGTHRDACLVIYTSPSEPSCDVAIDKFHRRFGGSKSNFLVVKVFSDDDSGLHSPNIEILVAMGRIMLQHSDLSFRAFKEHLILDLAMEPHWVDHSLTFNIMLSMGVIPHHWTEDGVDDCKEIKRRMSMAHAGHVDHFEVARERFRVLCKPRGQLPDTVREIKTYFTIDYKRAAELVLRHADIIVATPDMLANFWLHAYMRPHLMVFDDSHLAEVHTLNSVITRYPSCIRRVLFGEPPMEDED